MIIGILKDKAKWNFDIFFLLFSFLEYMIGLTGALVNWEDFLSLIRQNFNPGKASSAEI